MQQAIFGRLTDQRVEPGARCGESMGIAPGLLNEFEAVLQAALVASKEESSLLERVLRKLRSIRDAVSDQTCHFHRVGGGTRIDFADMCSERTDEFVDAFVFEIVGGSVFDSVAGFGVILPGVVFWVQGDRSSY